MPALPKPGLLKNIGNRVKTFFKSDVEGDSTGKKKAIAIANPYTANLFGASQQLGDMSRGFRKPTKVSFAHLRKIAQYDALIGICINIIKKEVSQSDWNIVPTKDHRDDYNPKHIDAVNNLFTLINRNGENMRLLLDRILDDLLTLDAACLFGDELVELADGSKMTIRNIVDNKLPVDVLSFNEKLNQIEVKKVIGWHKNQLNGRKWVKVNHEFARNMGRHGKKSTWFTDDHKLLTSVGWKEIKDINNADLVVTKEQAPNNKQVEIITGTMLGDACFNGRMNSYRVCLTLAQCLDQEPWLDAKISALNCFKFSEKACRTVENMNSTVLSVRSNYGGWLEKEAKRWLDDKGKKIVPKDLVLTDLVLATWFMDDGHSNLVHTKNPNNTNTKYETLVSYFNTCGFTESDQQFLVEKLNNFGIKCNLQKCGEYFRIYVSAEGTKILFNKISKYIIPELRYKLKNFIGASFKSIEWEPTQPNVFFDTIEKEYGNPLGKNYLYNLPQNTYCIDVEDNHNFITSGLVAHNCMEKVFNAKDELVELNSVDAATIRPCYNIFGELDPERAYVQVINEKVVAEFKNSELIYMMQNPQNDIYSFGYGQSPIEKILLTVQASLNADLHNAEVFSQDNVPPGLLDLGDMSQEEATQFIAIWNATVVNDTHKMKFVWGSDKDKKYIPFKGANKDMQYMEYIDWLSRIKLAAFGLTSIDANITQDVNRATAKTQESITKSRGIKSAKALIEEYFNREIILPLGFTDVEFKFVEATTLEEKRQQAEIDKIYIEAGVYTPKDVAKRDGLETSEEELLLIDGLGSPNPEDNDRADQQESDDTLVDDDSLNPDNQTGKSVKKKGKYFRPLY